MNERWSPEERLPRMLSILLRTGVFVSAGLVLVGGTLYLARHGTAMSELGTFHGEPEMLHKVPGIIQSVTRLSSRGIIQLGLLVLIATPILRVVFSFFTFLKERDYLYVAVTFFVLLTLCYSLFFGI